MHNEQFFGRRQLKRPSRREIQEMIANMKKVDTVKEKSDTYHQKEVEKLEKLLDLIND